MEMVGGQRCHTARARTSCSAARSVTGLGALMTAYHVFAGCTPSEPRGDLTHNPCVEQSLPEGETSTGLDLILITVDTLRSDHIGAYGYEFARTPTIDHLAESGTLFSEATAPMPRTTPALGTLLTGLWPHRHGSRDIGQPLTSGKSLATLLCELGYETVAVTSNPAASAAQNLHRGFDSFLSLPASADAEEVNSRAIDLVQQVAREAPLFLWLHYVDPHFPYSPPKRWKQPKAHECRRLRKERTSSEIFSNRGGHSERALSECIKLYDAEIAYTDAQIGEMLKWLGDNRSLEKALVVFSADHGENLGEAGLFYEHGPNLHDAGVRVPLIISRPMTAGKVDDRVIGLEDVMPTILSVLRVPKPMWPEMDGQDYSDSRDAPPTERPLVAFAESGIAMHASLFGYLQSGMLGDLYCLNHEHYSLCTDSHGEQRLYDRETDPDLSMDVGAQSQDVRQQLLDASALWPPGTARERSARTSRFKLVEYPLVTGGYRRVLYDLQDDSGEPSDAISKYPDVVAALQEELDTWVAGLPSPALRALNARQLEGLRELGYVK